MNFAFFLTHVWFQMRTSRLARKSAETLFSIQRNLPLSVNLMGVGLRFNAKSPRGIAGAWTAVAMRSLVLEVLIWRFALCSVCIPLLNSTPNVKVFYYDYIELFATLQPPRSTANFFLCIGLLAPLNSVS